ncbi:hypothetical protein MPTK1_2g19070 [Marchantia polymorpha subsp. ruderalis]|uniref:Viral late gene transcription factor 3 zinc ribbon domain-containing protein n=1 Tax=Marchantia polymorpha TaxID=3197 RepID=A0A2R6W8K6_MARPO|nr:hypothetical protein MARPO_0128s0022 [Marchantia polymorpha]BBN02897.1 hypothetical protein Mp_2g19070 [Marchantia polymorpha subsp. ruderalis]|eukprot:PTQ30200.1 hypothetical protein MARPO_0128s0022 [Marchantia polymorpha]
MALVISGTELFPSSSVNGLVCLRKVELVQQRQPHRRLKVEQQRVGVRASSELLEPVTSAATTDLTWQITAGAIAGVTPFVVAGIEFSKRIMEQKRCQVCGGSGLVKRVGILVRCNGCGGFLPWQSWRRFFSGK